MRRNIASWTIFLAIGFVIAFGKSPTNHTLPQPQIAAMATLPPHQESQTASIAAVVVTPTPTPIPTIQPTPQPTTAPIYAGDVHQLIVAKATARFGAGELSAMLDLVSRESGASPYAVNPSSGACGIPQAYPCSKLIAAIGSLDNVSGQVDWMLDYIANRYGTPSRAIAHHNHVGWY